MYLRYAICILAFLGFSTITAFGCEQHFPDGTIGNCPDQTCEDFIDPQDGTTCVDCSITTYQNTGSYISYSKISSEAWIVTGAKRVKIMSDKYLSFSKEMYKKYKKNNKISMDKTLKEKIKNEYAAFFKTDDNKVSKNRLENCGKLLNLKIRTT